MGAITSAVVAIVAVILGWVTIEIACRPCLDKGREAIDHALDPNYDPDSSLIATNRQPFIEPPSAVLPIQAHADAPSASKPA